MKTKDLTGRLLSYWACHAEFPDLGGKRILNLIRTGAYKPHIDIWHASKLAEQNKIGTAFADISQTWFAGRTDPADPKSRVWVESPSYCEAITRAFVTMKLGKEVDERLGLDLEERQPEADVETVDHATDAAQPARVWPFPSFVNKEFKE